ncbi:MAG: hypothetical protein H7336_13210 [Bacteriovorax sp.]|nr:hypothetical protein [Bacteriovorax sp.]
MKKLLCLLVLLSSLQPLNNAWSFDTSVRGFIALDALNFEKVSGQKGSTVIGIGVLDLKVFAEQDDMAAAIKLNLDGKLDRQNTLFEEAYVTYKGVPDFRFILGKGIIKFQNLHWGVIENTYQDGGTIIGTENQIRKLSNKAFVSASYGGRSKGFVDQFTVWGDSTQMYSDENGSLTYVSTGSTTVKTITGYKTEEVAAFDTAKQLGLANKFDFYLTDSWKVNFGQMYYKNRMSSQKANYGFDFGANYESSKMEFWMDAIYGFSSRLPYDSYTTKVKNEYFLQLGMEYYLNEKWSLVENVEGLYVKDLQHTYTTFVQDGVTYNPTSFQAEKSGSTYKIFTYKLETGLKYKITKSSQVTFGGLYEKKQTSVNGTKDLAFVRDVRNANADAYQGSASISFWF